MNLRQPLPPTMMVTDGHPAEQWQKSGSLSASAHCRLQDSEEQPRYRRIGAWFAKARLSGIAAVQFFVLIEYWQSLQFQLKFLVKTLCWRPNIHRSIKKKIFEEHLLYFWTSPQTIKGAHFSKILNRPVAITGIRCTKSRQKIFEITFFDKHIGLPIHNFKSGLNKKILQFRYPICLSKFCKNFIAFFFEFFICIEKILQRL